MEYRTTLARGWFKSNSIPLLRFLFPSFHKRAQTRLDSLRYDTLPAYRLRTQTRFWNFILRRQAKSRERQAAGRGILASLRRHRNRLASRNAVSKMSEPTSEDTSFGRGTRRKKFAGYLKAANELRQSYSQAYLGSNRGGADAYEGELDIPGAFPNLKVSRSGNEEMVLFPSYARRHNKTSNPPQNYPISSNLQDVNGAGDAEYWRKEWEFWEDRNAVVDVDVRGWVYSPQSGPMTRKNRIMLGIARHLSGIPAPSSTSDPEDKLAEKQAAAITQKGEMEADVAGRGGYSEVITGSPSSSRSASPKPGQFPHPLTNSSLKDENQVPSSKRASWASADLSPRELATANEQLLRRLKPFFTTPTVGMSLTVFYYNEHTSQSRTTRTNESGHFNFRAALDFIPTSVRVLASESLSATADVAITEPRGISLISDIDDTIKHSAIGSGAKEIFRNAFVRELSDLTIDGVQDWYQKMADVGVKLHYVSNSPWQMYPILVTYFAHAQLPPGSFHLKQYSGMLQGIFEPVAERKKGTLDRIMNDFPERRFILVGDSGEADLELYVETALRDPKRILAIYIRDVTTTEDQQFFNSSSQTTFGVANPLAVVQKPGTSSNKLAASTNSKRPILPPRAQTTQAEPEDDLMTFSDDDVDPLTVPKLSMQRYQKPKPPPPSKPVALRSNSGDQNSSKPPPPPPPQRRAQNGPREKEHRKTPSLQSGTAYRSMPPTALYDDTEERMSARLRETRLSDAPPLPPRRGLSSYPASAAQYASNRIWGDGSNSRSSSPAPVNKREEVWKRRLARAKESLEGKGVILKTWRVGSDVEQEAVKLVKNNRWCFHDLMVEEKHSGGAGVCRCSFYSGIVLWAHRQWPISAQIYSACESLSATRSCAVRYCQQPLNIEDVTYQGPYSVTNLWSLSMFPNELQCLPTIHTHPAPSTIKPAPSQSPTFLIHSTAIEPRFSLHQLPEAVQSYVTDNLLHITDIEQ